MKKAAIMLYPLFSMQEISCTTELFKFYDKEIVTFSAGREAVKSEDGFTVLPDKGFEEFRREEFDCLVLPGIWEPRLKLSRYSGVLRFFHLHQQQANVREDTHQIFPRLLKLGVGVSGGGQVADAVVFYLDPLHHQLLRQFHEPALRHAEIFGRIEPLSAGFRLPAHRGRPPFSMTGT